MDQKGNIIDQKGLNMYEKRQKIEFSNLKYLFLAEFSLAELRDTSPTPLNGKSFCPKTLSGNGGYSPLAEKIDLTHIGLEIVKYRLKMDYYQYGTLQKGRLKVDRS